MTASVKFTLLNTRPAHQAKALSLAVQAINGQVVSCPTINIQWLEDETLLSPLPKPDMADKIIFTSVNAVEGFINNPLFDRYVQALISKESQTHCYAIGRATQQKGIALGLPLEVLSKTNFDSESLLMHPVMQEIKDETFVIIKGESGRPLLIDTLQQRGAKVFPLDIYRRVAADFCEQNWQLFSQSICPILLITSVESFESLLSSLINFNQSYANMDDPIWSFLTNTIVFSQRIEQHLLAKGWLSPISIVTLQSNEGVLQCLPQV